MFRHIGKTRTYIHNARLAAILSFIAGIVNITGLLSARTLTTNVTGHFAYFAEEVVNQNYAIAFIYLFFILSFLFGSFVSNLLIEIVSRIKPQQSFLLPMILEIILLSFVALFGTRSLFSNYDGQLIAYTLLFSMGLQNSLVTKVSQSVVRTTHLTGLFTDLGIELSQLFFYRHEAELKNLKKSIYLRLTIISFFFTGCIAGGFYFKTLELKTLLIASAFLVLALFYDYLIFNFYNLKRKVFLR